MCQSIKQVLQKFEISNSGWFYRFKNYGFEELLCFKSFSFLRLESLSLTRYLVNL